MGMLTRSALALALAATSGLSGRAEDSTRGAKSSEFVPLRPQTRAELTRLQALTVYGLGVLRQNQDRLVEATQLFEEARELDPTSAPLHKVLIPLYVALRRSEEALAACRRVLDLDPDDYDTWSLYGKQLKNRGRLKEAREALARALACQGVAEHPDLRVQLHFDLGVLWEETQDYDHAVDAFGQAVKILDDPHSLSELDGFDRQGLEEQAANTYERMIKLCIQAQEYDRALEVFAEGRQKHPVLAQRLNYSLAKIHAGQGRPAEALAPLDEYLSTQPQGAEAYELRIALLEQLQRSDEIVPSLEKAAQQDAHNVPLHLLLAQQCAAAGQFGKAEKVYQELAESGPTPEVYHGLFTMYRNGPADGLARVLTLFDDAVRKSSRGDERTDGDPQAAAQARAMLATLREDFGVGKALLPVARRYVQSGSRPLHPQTELLLAALAGRARQREEAEFFYRRCLHNGSAKEREVAVYGGLIQVLWKAHKHEALVEVCRQGLEKTPTADQALFHNNLARALVYLGKTDEAVAEADKAVATSGEGSRLGARLSRLFVLERAERYPQAVAEGQALLKEYKLPSDVSEIRHRLSNLYSSMGEHAKSEEQLQLILQADPNDATANNDLGYYWADQGKSLEEAERLIRRALELDRLQKKTAATMMEEEDADNAAFLDSLGWVLFRRGQPAAARALLEKAASLTRDEEDPVIWDHLGDVYFRLADKTRARSAWQKSLALYETEKRLKADTHCKELKRKLKMLESDSQDP
jgi:tetratricopeptide (TPR) repeat protein